MDKIVLYTTHCPLCLVLEEKLKKKKIAYETVEDVDVIKSLGFNTVPVLKVNNDYMMAQEAMKYVNNI